MTKPEPFDEKTAQWVYENIRNTGCYYYDETSGCCTRVDIETRFSYCPQDYSDCPLFKESEQE